MLFLRPFCGAILASALYILFRFLDYDQYSAGIDAENQAQYLRAQAAVNGDHNTTTYNQNQYDNGTTSATAATATSNVLPR